MNLPTLLGKLLLALLAFPPIYIVVKYCQWCSKQDDQESKLEEEED